MYKSFKNAKDYGSILDIKNINFDNLLNSLYDYESNKYNLNKFKFHNEIQLMKNIIHQSKLLAKNYDIVVTNPPYMGNSGMNPNLKEYLKNNYSNSKSDLFAVFIEKCHDFCNETGFIAMITQQSFMFLSTFEKLRVELINNHTIINMAHLGAHAFEEIGGEDVQATTFVNRNNFIENYNSTFHRLTEFNSESKKEKEFHNDENSFVIKKERFNEIPGNPIAYWADNNIINSFKIGTPIKELCDIKQGLKTADNNRFLRYWFEINYNNIGFGYTSSSHSKISNLKWFPYNKGGDYRKWYGNHYYVVNWFNDGFEIKNFKDSNGKLKSRPQNLKFYFKESISWSTISSGNIAFRYYPEGFIFDGAGSSIFTNDNLYYIFGLLNSNVSKYVLSFISPTISYEIGHISLIPIIFDLDCINEVNQIVRRNIDIVSEDWDDYEISWNFITHPFLYYHLDKIENCFKRWVEYKEKQFSSLRYNEYSLNEIFSKIYNVSINIDVEDKHISVIKSNYVNDVKSFISFAVGCMFGRYSLDNNGLQFAGGEFNINNYNKFIPDDDNIIPVLDSEYFEDDIVGRFVEFVKVCFGEEHLEENLDFIANALAKNKKPSRDKIRDYLLKNFFNDHKKTYKKCPIYWQFSSGKQNGFNCIVYMHRYEPSLVARIRTDYLHKTQKAIEQALVNCDNIINHSSSNTEISKATKDKSKLQKQLQETIEYDEALAHIANQNIEIDLDDGVKVNYAKFQNVEVSKEGKKSKKINLLKKL